MVILLFYRLSNWQVQLDIVNFCQKVNFVGSNFDDVILMLIECKVGIQDDSQILILMYKINIYIIDR